jgi:hypothetical protein
MLVAFIDAPVKLASDVINLDFFLANLDFCLFL